MNRGSRIQNGGRVEAEKLKKGTAESPQCPKSNHLLLATIDSIAKLLALCHSRQIALRVDSNLRDRATEWAATVSGVRV